MFSAARTAPSGARSWPTTTTSSRSSTRLTPPTIAAGPARSRSNREAAPPHGRRPRDPRTRRAAAPDVHLLPGVRTCRRSSRWSPDEPVADARLVAALRGQVRTDEWRAAVTQIAADGHARG